MDRMPGCGGTSGAAQAVGDGAPGGPTSVASDQSLAERAAAGSRAAFEDLIERYTGRLSHFLRSRASSREDLEDLVQETFLKAYRNIDRYDARWAFATWLYTIAARLAISRHRSAGSRPFRPVTEDPTCASPGPQESLVLSEEAEGRKNVWSVARTLGPSAYEALWLRYAEEMPMKDIARAMGKTQMGVRALLHRSRIRLGERLREAGPSAPPRIRAGAAAERASAAASASRKSPVL